MALTDWLNRIAQATGVHVSHLQDPAVLEDAVAELWLSGEALPDAAPDAAPDAPPTLAKPRVRFAGLFWSRSLVSESELMTWGGTIDRCRSLQRSTAPAIGVPLELARELAHAQGGRLPRMAEWSAAVSGAAPGNHGLKWGGPTPAGVFPAARSGILDGWGNAWEWTEEGLAVGGSFASPSHPTPVKAARLTGFRIVA